MKIKLIITLVVATIIAATIYYLLPNPVPVTPPGKPPSVTPKTPIFRGDKTVVVADSTGKVEVFKVDTDTPVEAVATVRADGTDVNIIARVGARGWFPGVTKRPRIILETLDPNDAGKVLVTYQPKPLIDWNLNSISAGGAYYQKDFYVNVSWTPLDIWAFSFGAGAYVNSSFDVQVRPVTQIEVRDRLFITGSLGKDVIVGLNYRF